MSEPTPHISLKIQEQMELICRHATAGGDDALHIRAELYGHLEDKLLAYLRGDERLTEADAMILVREHFGKPETLRSILRDIHEEVAPFDGVPLIRKLLALSVAAAGIGLSVSVFVLMDTVLMVFFTMPSAYSHGVRHPVGADAPRTWMVTWHWTSFVWIGCLSTALLWLAVRRFRCSRTPVETRWFVRWYPGIITVCILGTMLARLRPSFLYDIEERMPIAYLTYTYRDTPAEEMLWTFSLISAATMFLSCLIWMNWTGGRRPLTRAGLAGAAGWATFSVLADFAPEWASWFFRGQPLALGVYPWVTAPLYYFSIAACVVGLVAAWYAARWAQHRILIRAAWASQPIGS